MKVIKFILKLISILILLFVLFVLYASFSDYKPDISELVFESEIHDTIDINKELSLMIWNIGYCGLSDDMDFFYDGGKQVRTSKENVNENFDFVKSELSKNDSIDFILLQEVDLHSKRSYYLNELDSFNLLLTEFKSFFGKNYDVTFVPSPITKPLGKVKSGLVSYSKYNPKLVTRYSFPGNYSWPVKLFMLDRCFLVKRFPTSNEKELIVINTHNSAYDDGSLKKQQMEYLKTFLLKEHEKGNYIIVGGDWNQNPPEIDYSDIKENSPTQRFVLNPINKDYLPTNWIWVYDASTPTNRYLDAPFEHGKTITPIIDFYLMSPNIFSISVKTQDFDFKHTDHQSVIVKIKLI
ncbi:endonuclease/exonuclease/phosphatase family protein [Bacteroidota bacterium]